MTEANGKPIDPDTAGPQLAAEMVRNLALLNEQMKDGQALHVELKDSVDQLIGHCEVFGRAMEIICDQKEEGKSKFSLSDFAEAYLDAADEIMPADDDEPGPEDPLVESRR